MSEISGSNVMKFMMIISVNLYVFFVILTLLMFPSFSWQSSRLLFLYYASSNSHYAWTLHRRTWSILFQLNATAVIINLILFCLRITSHYILKHLTWVSESSIKHSIMWKGNKWYETSLEHTFILASMILWNCLFIHDWFHYW